MLIPELVVDVRQPRDIENLRWIINYTGGREKLIPEELLFGIGIYCQKLYEGLCELRDASILENTPNTKEIKSALGELSGLLVNERLALEGNDKRQLPEAEKLKLLKPSIPLQQSLVELRGTQSRWKMGWINRNEVDSVENGTHVEIQRRYFLSIDRIAEFVDEIRIFEDMVDHLEKEGRLL
jgi:hypothetical protein